MKLKQTLFLLIAFLFNHAMLLADPSKYGRPSDFNGGSGSGKSNLYFWIGIFIVVIVVNIVQRFRNKGK